MASITPASHLYITDISVDLSKSGKDVQSAEARIGTLSGTPIEHHEGKTLSQTFVPPLTLSRRDSFSLRLLCKTTQALHRHDRHNIQFDLEDIFHRCGVLRGPERQEYFRSHGGITIVLRLLSAHDTPDLPLTTDDISRICPRFRILVIGKTGVGKSSLIERAFGVKDALISNFERGEANIDTELISAQNDKFVLHDSKGFEPGDGGNVNAVREFIERRGSMPDLKDQLHAIWLCFEIPRTGGRLLETGTKDFLKLRSDGQLGKVPFIVVFTKYDGLIDQMDHDLGPCLEEGLSDDAINELVKERADTKLRETCIEPLKALPGPDIPHAAVSTDDKYAQLLACLIKLTEEHVHKHFAADASVMASIAQRVNHELKIKASIDVGKRRYWEALASCTPFKDRTAWSCLRALHNDIIAVWNFHDPHCYLSSKEFRSFVMSMVDELDVEPTVNPNNTITTGLSILGSIATILANHNVVPIVASAVLAKWVYDMYQASHGHLQRFISYIIDLTLVLQTLYLVSDSRELSRRGINLAAASYHSSPMRASVHAKVQDYVEQLKVLERMDRYILDKIIELINLYTIDSEEMSHLRAKISAFGWKDEP
ncbi:hypothetical protein M405DRAFT_792377 [Rhizopogon salebrosus TDB-379]|nr:hypothetical protein M405DRAFT_792377 [Rhizopogon salebrosus TDB-379]